MTGGVVKLVTFSLESVVVITIPAVVMLDIVLCTLITLLSGRLSVEIGINPAAETMTTGTTKATTTVAIKPVIAGLPISLAIIFDLLKIEMLVD
jgi:hypothetical protein